jgi:integrase
LKQAKRSEKTIGLYSGILTDFARFADVPVEELHNHLDPDILIKYAEESPHLSESTLRVRLGIIQRFYSLNGVKFDELEINILKPKRINDQDDKPLELETLQKMMDLGDTHAKAILSILISTGMRAGECCQLTVSDVKGDAINIRNEIAKGKRGGIVYLTTEAQEYLNLWMKDRDRYLKRAKTKNYSHGRAKDDPRLFGISYPTMRRIFKRLYDLVDGERGKYWSRCTIHSCRKYFRTNAVKTMPLDLVEKIMRHSGYLTGSYVRISNEEARKTFHEGETVLYLTRADHRIQGSKLNQLEQMNRELQERLERVENRDMTISALDNVQGNLTSEDHAAIARLIAEELKKGKRPGK